MQNLITKINGVDIVTVERDGETFVPIKPICAAIGIDFKSQYEKLQEDETLGSTVVLSTTVGADGKDREMVCLPLIFVYGWLFTINPRNVSEEARPAVTAYRRECYIALYDHFAGAAKRQQEQNRAEQDLLDRKAAALEAIAASKREMRSIDEQLGRLQKERLNPQPTLFN